MLDRSADELRRQVLIVSDLQRRLEDLVQQLPRQHAASVWRGPASDALHHAVEIERARLGRELLRLENTRRSLEFDLLHAQALRAAAGLP